MPATPTSPNDPTAKLVVEGGSGEGKRARGRVKRETPNVIASDKVDVSTRVAARLKDRHERNPTARNPFDNEADRAALKLTLSKGKLRKQKAHYCERVALRVCDRLLTLPSLAAALAHEPLAPNEGIFRQWIDQYPTLCAKYIATLQAKLTRKQRELDLATETRVAAERADMLAQLAALGVPGLLEAVQLPAETPPASPVQGKRRR